MICNKKYHGGRDQAIYLYSVEDYAWWSDTLGQRVFAGTFGENFTTSGQDLSEICVNQIIELIKEKLAPRFLKLQNYFKKNDTLYFMFFRFIGGGGAPYAVQNILPLLFEMPLKNYVIATFLGSAPSMFVTVSLGSGIESVIDENSKINLLTVLLSPDIYMPIIGFFILLTVGFVIKKFYFKQ